MNMNPPNRIRHLFLLLAVFIMGLPVLSHAQLVGEVVIKRGTVDDDLYIAGGQVDLYATVNGDVLVAGGQLNLEGDISEDLTAAGGSISLRGSVADDARVAGGELRVSARIGDDLVAAAGRIHLSPVATTAGRAWLSGGDIRVDGQVGQELRISGGRVVITGTVNGNAEIWAERIIIEDTAVIAGNLHYRSASKAEIASGARIDGEVIHTPVKIDMKPVIASLMFASLVILLSLVVTAVLMYALFPVFSVRVSQSLRHQPWLSLGIGLAVFAAVPVSMLVLFSTIVGVWLALMLLAIYLVIMLLGYLTGALAVGNAGLAMLHKVDAGKAMRATALALAIVALAMINLVPLLGGLLNWLVLLAGMGALSRQLYLLYRA